MGKPDAHLRSVGRNKKVSPLWGVIARRAVSYLKAIPKIRLGLLWKYRGQGKSLKEAEALIEKRLEERRNALLRGY